jgi:uncharacterized protein YhhL (DUF1145 family)
MTPTLQVTCVTLANLFHFIHPKHIVVVVVVLVMIMMMMMMIVLYSGTLKEFKIVKITPIYIL